MPAAFDAIDQLLQDAMEELYGELVTIRPMAGADPNYGRGPDGSRPVVPNIVAVISIGPMAAGADYSGSTRSGAGMAQGAGEIWLSAAALAAIGYALRRGDVIERANGERYQIAPPPPTEQGDMTAPLLAGD